MFLSGVDVKHSWLISPIIRENLYLCWLSSKNPRKDPSSSCLLHAPIRILNSATCDKWLDDGSALEIFSPGFGQLTHGVWLAAKKFHWHIVTQKGCSLTTLSVTLSLGFHEPRLENLEHLSDHSLSDLNRWNRRFRSGGTWPLRLRLKNGHTPGVTFDGMVLSPLCWVDVT